MIKSLSIVSLVCLTFSGCAEAFPEINALLKEQVTDLSAFDAAYGRGDYPAAVIALEALARQGHAKAQFNLGLMHDKGEGVRVDHEEAASRYLPAAEQGIAEAQYNLGIMYAKGQGVFQNDDKATYWFTKAAEQGYVVPRTELASVKEKKMAAFHEAAMLPAPNAPPPPLWERFKPEKAAPPPSSQPASAPLPQGRPPQDSAKAVEWWRSAAEQGNAEAQTKIATLLAAGNGTDRNYNEAFDWFAKAAEQGNAEAQANLGIFYFKGYGVARDRIKAYMWFDLAAEQGFKTAEGARDNVRKMMNDEQVATAEDMVKIWLETHGNK